MNKTKIEWADTVWNPVTGCNKVSQGCKYCYAERIAERFWGERKFTDVRVHPERLLELSRWRKPRRVFVNSMSDLFHESVPDEFILKVFRAMIWGNRRHTYMILTKRPERMVEWFTKYQYDVWSQSEYSAIPFPDPCVWLGVSVEDQDTADERIPLLLQTPAAVRFVSYEPAIGPVDFQGWDGKYQRNYLDPGFCGDRSKRGPLDWIIMGGESGPNARPLHPLWVRHVKDQCLETGVKFYFKQWGEWIGTGPFDKKPMGDYRSHEWNGGYSAWRVGKKNAGRLLDGQEWSQYPEVTK